MNLVIIGCIACLEIRTSLADIYPRQGRAWTRRRLNVGGCVELLTTFLWRLIIKAPGLLPEVSAVQFTRQPNNRKGWSPRSLYLLAEGTINAAARPE